MAKHEGKFKFAGNKSGQVFYLSEDVDRYIDELENKIANYEREAKRQRAEQGQTLITREKALAGSKVTKLNESEIKELCMKYRQGRSKRRLAIEYSISRATVDNYLKRMEGETLPEAPKSEPSWSFDDLMNFEQQPDEFDSFESSFPVVSSKKVEEVHLHDVKQGKPTNTMNSSKSSKTDFFLRKAKINPDDITGI